MPDVGGPRGLDALLAGHPGLPNDTAGTAAALWFQPVVPEAVAQSRQSPCKKSTAPLVGSGRRCRRSATSFTARALVRGLVPCGYGGSLGPALGLDFLPCGTGMFVAISLPLVSHGNVFSGRFRASDDL